MRCVGASCILMVSVGCASYGSVAETYGGKGMHEIATYYRGAQHLEDPDDAKATAALSASIQAASQRLDQDIDSWVGQSKFREALGATLRKEDVLRYGKILGAGNYDADALAAATAKAQKQAAAEAVAKVDALESGSAPSEELLAALRAALALNPDDGELAARYQRVRQKLTVNVVVRSDCSRGVDAMACQHFIDRFVMAILASNSELVRIVPADSPAASADMLVSLNATYSDTQWQRTKQGKAEAEVERKNRFNETERAANGRPLMDKVTALFTLYERTARASLRAHVRVLDATPAHKSLFSAAPTQDTQDQRRYLDWTGDERALASIEDVGVDQTPPTDPLLLSLQGAEQMAEATAKDLLHQLDGKP